MAVKVVDDRLQYIFDILTGKDELSPAFVKGTRGARETQREIGKIQKTFNTLGKGGSGLLKTIFSLKGALVAVGGALLLKEAINASSELENSFKGLRSVAGALGADVKTVENAALDASKDGLIPLANVTNSFKNLLAATNGDVDATVKTFNALRDAAAFNRQGTLDLGQAIEGATQGIKNQNSVLVDNAGITKNLSVIYKEYAVSINKSVGQLTEQEKATAAVVGIQKEALLFQGDYNKLLGTFQSATARAGTQFNRLLAQFGDLITKNPTIIQGIEKLGDGFGRLRSLVENNRKEFSELAGVTFVNLVKVANLTALGILNVADAIFEVTRRVESFRNRSQLAELKKDLENLDKLPKPDLLPGVEQTAQGADITRLAIEKAIASLEGAETKEKESFERRKKAFENFKSEIDKILTVEFKPVSDSALAEQDARKRIEIEKSKFSALNALRQEQANREAEEREIDKVEEQIRNEEEFEELKTNLGERQAARRLFEAQQLADAGKTAEAIKKIRKASEDSQKRGLQSLFDFEKNTNAGRAANFRSTLGTISTLQSQQNKELFFIGKAAAIAQATVDGIVAVQKAWAVGGPFAAPLVALVATATALNVAKIASQKPPSFQTGGVLGGFGGGATSGGDNGLFEGRRGEMLLNAPQQKNLFDFINNQGTNISGDGNIEEMIARLENRPISVSIGRSELFRVIREGREDGQRI